MELAVRCSSRHSPKMTWPFQEEKTNEWLYLQGEHSPANSECSQVDPFQVSDFQRSKSLDMCSFQQLSMCCLLQFQSSL